MKICYLGLLVFFVAIIFPIESTAQRQQDSLALIALYNSTNGDNWIDNSNWLTDEPIDNWFGITVEDDRVTAIELLGNDLSGSIPSQFGNMNNLQVLSLAENQLLTPDIIGETDVCSNSIETYTTTSIEGIINQWSVSGGTIEGASTDASLSVKWSSSSSGSIKLIQTIESTNSIDSTEIDIIIHQSPDLEINGEFYICNEGTYSYTVKSIPETTNLWATTGGKILNNRTSDSIAVKWDRTLPRRLILIRTTSFSSGNCSGTITKNIESVEKVTRLSLPEIEIDPKEQHNNIITIPIILDDPGCLFISGKPEMARAYVRIKKSMFLPINNVTQDYFDNGIWRTIELKAPVVLAEAGETVLSIRGHAPLGDALETPIYIDSLFWIGLNIQNEYESGLLKLIGVPDIGGLRLLKTAGIELLSVFPNPTNNILNLMIESSENIDALIEIYTTLGEKVFEHNIELSKGLQEANIKTPSDLSSGIYRIVLRSRNVISTRNIFINK